ncbi:DUF3455 domain-containing protein [Piscinibacter sp. XHJ-5]|uniref:DUF3455 domain-containing protein n=1 Tax=Piscinibacter sp. XHJ-5 TaxID=3037797 RepID=UPI0024537178|nr:DUF3455 domain-containing protein [Piscinibacter sp. XHJ-5]
MTIHAKAAALLGAVCTAAATATEPAALRPPAGETMALELHARGVQIYECAAAKDAQRFEWSLKGPEAALFYRGGRSAGIHYAGPSWQALDGSTVVAQVAAREDSPDPSAIPWLLLRTVSTRGEGVFSRVLSIQRVDTVGGRPPAEPCTPEQAGRVAPVAYSATYNFFVAEH